MMRCSAPKRRTPGRRRIVRVATGRDYRDVSPVRGVYTGASSSILSVDVAVDALSPQQQQQEQEQLRQQEHQQQ